MRGRPRWVDVLGSNVQFGKHVVTDADAAFGHCYGPNSNIAGNKLNLFPAVFGPCIFRISYSYHVGCSSTTARRRYLVLAVVEEQPTSWLWNGERQQTLFVFGRSTG